MDEIIVFVGNYEFYFDFSKYAKMVINQAYAMYGKCVEHLPDDDEEESNKNSEG